MTRFQIATRARADVHEAALLALLSQTARLSGDPGFAGRVLAATKRQVKRVGHDDPGLAEATHEAFLGFLQAVTIEVFNKLPPKPRR